jgi:hypothetical protein
VDDGGAHARGHGAHAPRGERVGLVKHNDARVRREGLADCARLILRGGVG